MENEANNNDATVKMDPVDHDPGRTQVLPEDACPTQEPDPFAPREPLGATGPMSAVEEASSQDEEPLPQRHTLRNIALGMLLTVVVVLGGFAGWLAWDDARNASCHVPAGVTLDGDAVSGYSAAEVRSVVNRHIIDGTAGNAVLVISDTEQVNLEYPRLGDVDVDATVGAVMATIEPSAVARCLNRVLDLVGMAPQPQPRELVTVCALSEDRVHGKVEAIAREYDIELREAGYRFDQDKRKVKVVKARAGRSIDVDATTAAVLEASQSGQTQVSAVVLTTNPTVTKPGQAIFVDLYNCQLTFYVAGSVAKQYPCTPGMSGYATSSGDWTVSYKDPNPSWYNPHSDWSKGMPEVIAPGPTNPLGLRALALSCGGGIYIHGTTNLGQLGYPGSHGCIRLANESIVELFDLVELGIPVFVY